LDHFTREKEINFLCISCSSMLWRLSTGLRGLPSSSCHHQDCLALCQRSLFSSSSTRIFPSPLGSSSILPRRRDGVGGPTLLALRAKGTAMCPPSPSAAALHLRRRQWPRPPAAAAEEEEEEGGETEAEEATGGGGEGSASPRVVGEEVVVARTSEALRSVVRLEVAVAEADPSLPWQKGRPYYTSGSACVIESPPGTHASCLLPSPPPPLKCQLSYDGWWWWWWWWWCRQAEGPDGGSCGGQQHVHPSAEAGHGSLLPRLRRRHEPGL